MNDSRISTQLPPRSMPVQDQVAVKGETLLQEDAAPPPCVLNASPLAQRMVNALASGEKLSRLMHQPATANRIPTAVSLHLFKGHAQAFATALGAQLAGELPNLLTRQHDDFTELRNGLAQQLAEYRQVAVFAGAQSASPMASDPPSFQDILDGLQDLIGTIREDYLDVYASLVEKYADMFSDFSAEILARLYDWTSAVGDDGYVSLNVGKLREALNNLVQKYSYPNDAAVLFPEAGQGASKEDAEKWLKAMGLPASSLKDRGDGTFCVVMDLGPLMSMIDGLPPRDGEVPISPAAFQAWQSAFNAQQQAMESALQKFTQKYSNANAIHDNVQKTISSTLSSLFDMLKAFAASLGA